MQRTYKSKKDVGGGLDHRDILLTVDEKSSAFDAFYIQNIKQTKRELSCMGASSHHGVSSNKVRKKKYVKRIVKDLEPLARESLSGSVFLTPDKSIHVNKAPDPFDQLLNSSPVQFEPKQAKKTNFFDQLFSDRPAKTYIKKRRPQKKLNYSSSDSIDSDDKENAKKSNANENQNITDIHAHEFLIEPESKPGPILDKSINNIVRKMTQLNNLSHRSSNSPIEHIFRSNINRLTNNLQSPGLRTSPLSSTPYRDKYRSKSIYKFSPIPIQDLEDSTNFVSIIEENDRSNESVILIPKTVPTVKRITENNMSCSPLTHLPNSKKISSSKSLFSTADKSSSSNIHNEENSESKESVPVPVVVETKESSNIEIISVETSEVKPFLGFSTVEVVKIPEINEVFIDDKEYEKSIIFSVKSAIKETSSLVQNIKTDSKYESENNKHSNSENRNSTYRYYRNQSKEESIISNVDDAIPSEPLDESQNNQDSSNETQNNKHSNSDIQISTDGYYRNQSKEEPAISKVDETIPSEPFLGFTKVETEIDLSSESDVQNLSNEKLEQSNVKDENTSTDSQDEDRGYLQSDVNDENTSTESQEVGSLYNTCSSEKSYLEKNLKVPAVVIERMNDSVFMKYYKRCQQADDNDDRSAHNKSDNDYKYQINSKYSDNTSDSENSLSNSDSENIHSPDNLSHKSSSLNMEEIDDNICTNDTSNDERYSTSDDEDKDCISIYEESEVDKCSSILEENNSIDDEDRGISFVTTRRRNEHTNNSSVFVLDDTMVSVSSSDCDKTVISNKYNSKESILDIANVTQKNNEETFIDEDMTLKNASPSIANNKQHLGEVEPRTSSMTRKDSKLFKSNTTPSPDASLTITSHDEHSEEDSRIDVPRISSITIRKSAYRNNTMVSPDRKIMEPERPGIILQPGKKWERSLSIYRRMTMMADHFDHSLLDDEDLHVKGRKYRQSVISTMEMQEGNGSLDNDSINSRRSTFVSKPSRSTIRIVKEPNTSTISNCNATVLDLDDLKGFLEDCDDTVVELSRLSIAEREHDITVLEKFHEPSRVASARDYVLRRCNQTETILFDECYPDTALKNCRKIGEGVYGEVYLWRASDGCVRVMKIVPIAGATRVNGEQQKDFREIISEIVIAMELSALRAPIAELACHFDEGKDAEGLDLHSVENATDVFNEVLAVRCVYGSYPSRLLDLWELYDETRGSENDSPAALPADQQFIVLELANAGQDLESFQFNSAEQAHALFLQVAFGLAVGEEAFQFEHRDLHWGNVLIAPTDEKWATFVLRGRAHRVARRGVAATIIDYSLSRLSLPLVTGPGAVDAPRDTAAALYNDLAADPSLFGAVGDYQFEVYRRMRDKLGNDWKNFEPYTNILWLHYTVDKMITALRYKRTNTKTHKQYIAKLKALKDRILSYGSAVQFVLTDDEY